MTRPKHAPVEGLAALRQPASRVGHQPPPGPADRPPQMRSQRPGFGSGETGAPRSGGIVAATLQQTGQNQQEWSPMMVNTRARPLHRQAWTPGVPPCK